MPGGEKRLPPDLLQDAANLVMEQAQNNPPRFDVSLEGGSLANLLHSMLPPERFAPIRDDRCAHCGAEQTSSSETQLLVCSGCRGVKYCNRVCQKAAWKAHKPVCTTPEQRVDQVMAMFTTDHGFSRDAVRKALEITGQRVSAAHLLLTLYFTGEAALSVTKAEVCGAMNLLFKKKKVRLEDVEQLEQALPAEMLIKLTKERLRLQEEAETKRRGMEPIFDTCDTILKEMLPFMGGLFVERMDHTVKNREILEVMHSKIRTPYKSNHGAHVPAFLYLCSELLTEPIDYSVPSYAVRPMHETKAMLAALRDKVSRTWVAHARLYGNGSDDQTDADVLKMAKNIACIQHTMKNVPTFRSHGGPLTPEARYYAWIPKDFT